LSSPLSDSKRRANALTDIGDALPSKGGSLFSLSGRDGDLDTDVNAGHGLYFHDTRYLSRSALHLEGQKLSVLLSEVQGGSTVCELTNRDLQLRCGDKLGQNRLAIRRERSLDVRAVETIRVTNFGRSPVKAALEWDFDTDFKSMFAIRGAQQGQRGRLRPPAWQGARLRFGYDGADGRERSITLNFEPEPQQRSPGGAVFHLELDAGQSRELRFTAEVSDSGRGDLETVPRAQSSGGRLDAARLETDNPLFDRAFSRSMADLRMLLLQEADRTFFAAGIPWFVALFGRDSILTSLQTLPYDPAIAATTLEVLARHQGSQIDDYRDEQPGKILHELRVGEMANLGEVPQAPYYGTVDATPLFVILMAEYIRWTGDLALWRRLRQKVERALSWIDVYGDSDGDGFVDYATRSTSGARNQGWKDSGNSICNRDGSLAEPPIALVEVQGYVYRAKLDAAWLFRLDGDGERAAAREREARALKRRFADAYWMPDRKCLALAVGKGGRLAETISSNAGQALWSGIVGASHAHALAGTLLAPAMFSGWGVRTLAEGEAGYNPIDYHVGAVWPHDNGLVAAGLKRYGHAGAANRIFSGIFDAATQFQHCRLPEVFAGVARKGYSQPVRYPVACSPQAWASGALPHLLQTALGLRADATARQLVLDRPSLPDWLADVALSGIRVGDALLDLRCRRVGAETLVAVTGRRGDVSVDIRG